MLAAMLNAYEICTLLLEAHANPFLLPLPISAPSLALRLLLQQHRSYESVIQKLKREPTDAKLYRLALEVPPEHVDASTGMSLLEMAVDSCNYRLCAFLVEHQRRVTQSCFERAVVRACELHRAALTGH